MKNYGFLKKQYICFIGAIALFLSTNSTVFCNPLFSISMNGSTCSMTLSGLPQTSGAKARYKVYLNTDDGGWYMGETAAGATGNPQITFTHTYRTLPASTGYHPYFEYVEIYDDTQKPPPERVIYNPGTGGGHGSTSGNGFIPPAVNSTVSRPVYNIPGFVSIEPVRKIVAEDEVTFIVIYGNTGCAQPTSGDLKFKFDSQILTPKDGGLISYSGGIDNSYSQNGNLITISNIQLAAGEQRCLFLRFETNAGTAGQTLSVVPNVSFPDGVVPSPCNMESEFQLTGFGKVALAHDPNSKYIVPDFSAAIKYLDFFITFQNDGAAEATDITIDEELDSYLSCVPDALIKVTCPLNAKVTRSVLANGKFTVHLENIVGLMGTHQKGYGTLFFENATKSVVKISVPLCNTNIPHCSAIVNQADIRFGCNPPIKTDAAIFAVNCNGKYAATDTCTIAYDAYSAMMEVTGGTDFLPAGIDLSSYKDFHWYPESGLDLSDPANPVLKKLKNQVYTLIASGDCKRLVFTRTVKVPCDLKLSGPTLTASTNGNAPFIIETGYTGGGSMVEWQKCVPNPPVKFIYNNVGPGTYYFSVYDPETGCADEKWISTMQVTDPTLDCNANITLKGGAAGAVTYLWQYTDNSGVVHFSSQNQPMDMSDKNNVVVTVTDSNGNTAVFTPTKNCTAGAGSKYRYLLLAIGILVIGIVIFNWWRKR